MAEPTKNRNLNSVMAGLGDRLFLFIGGFCTFLFFHPVLVSGKSFFFRDLQTWFIPQKLILTNALKAGGLPFWNSHTFCGSPFLTDLQSGMFYLPSILFLVFPFPWSFNAYIALHFFAGFCFFYLFITSLGLSRGSGIVAATSFAFGGYLISSLNLLNQLSTLCWLPAVLWSYTVARTRRDHRYYFLCLFFLVLAASGGEPQFFAMIVALMVLHSLFTIPGGKIGEAIRPRSSGPILLLVVGVILICAVEAGPAYLDYRNSIRSAGFSVEQAAQFSVSWEMLRHLAVPLRFPADYLSRPEPFLGLVDGVFPYLLTVYAGFLVVPLSLVGLVAFWRKGSWLWLGLAVVGVILAVGTAGPAYEILHRHLPVFRFPSKFMLLASFSLVVLAACGYDRIERLARERGIRSWVVLLLIGGVVLGDLFMAHRHLNPVWPAGRLKTAHPDLAPLASDDTDHRIFVDRPSLFSDGAPTSFQAFQDRQQAFLAPNVGVLGNIDYVDGTTALELRFQYMMTEILAKPWPRRIRFLRLTGVKYIVSLTDLTAIPGVEEQVERVSPSLYRLRNPLPRAWVVGKLNPISEESMTALGYGRIEDLTRQDFTPSTTAWSAGSVVGRHTDAFHAEVTEIDYERPHLIRIRTGLDRPGVLFLAESFYAGWRVFVDGREATVLWLNFLFQGVELPAGEHDVEFRYFPEHFHVFLGISVVSVLTALGLFVVVWRRSG